MDKSSSRFRIPKTFDEEKACVINSIPKFTAYKNKWALQIFREWQGQKPNKICTIEPGGVFKGEDIGLDVQEMTESIENENAKSLIYWLCKLNFAQEVANKSGGQYPSLPKELGLPMQKLVSFATVVALRSLVTLLFKLIRLLFRC